MASDVPESLETLEVLESLETLESLEDGNEVVNNITPKTNLAIEV